MGKRNKKQYDKFDESKSTTGKDVERGSNGKKPDARNSFNGKKSGKPMSMFSAYKQQNDPLYYMGVSELVEPAASIPTFQQAGRAFALSPESTSPNDLTHTYLYKYTVPSIMQLKWIPSPGISRDSTSGMSIAASMLYQFIRGKLNYLTSYAPADLAVAMMCYDSLLIMYHEIVRIFGCVNYYSGYNLALPKALTMAAGLDEFGFKDLYQNLANYRLEFNQLVAKMKTIYMPITTTFNEKHMWCAENVWTDSNTHKAQIYIYKVSGVYLWNEMTSDQGSMAEFMSLSDTTSMGGYLTIFDGMIEAMRNSDSLAKIMADLRKAYDNAEGWKPAYLDEDYCIEIGTNDTVCAQIQNSTIYPFTYTDLNITQSVDKNIVLYDPTINLPNQAPYVNGDVREVITQLALGKQLVNFPMDNPNSKDIVEFTRNIHTFERFEPDSADAFPIRFAATSTDYLTTANVFIVDADTVMTTGLHNMFYLINGNTIANMNLTAFNVFSAFDWCPRVILINNAAAGKTTAVSGIAWDFNNFVLVPAENLAKLNEAITLSVWNVPADGAPASSGRWGSVK
nr:putative capsid [Marmot picobirnavirus]